MSGHLRRFHSRLALIVVAGLGLRVLYVFVFEPDVVGIGDWWFFHWQANLIADGRGFLDPFTLLNGGAGRVSAAHPPLWPVVLSAASWLGADGIHAHRAVGAPIGGVVIVLIALIGRRVGGERVGLVAAAIVALDPLFIAADGSLMSETLYGVFVAAALLAALELAARPRALPALGLGAAVGLAALTRGEALVFLLLLAVPVIWSLPRPPKARVVLAALAFGACLVVLVPWTVRNAIVFDRFVLISTNESTAVAGANCPLTYHGDNTGFWDIGCISERRLSSEAAQAAVWRREGLDYARDNVGALPRVAVIRVLRTWDFWQPRRMTRSAEGRARGWETAGIVVYYGLLVLAAAGAVLLRRRGRLSWVLVAPLVAVTVTSVLAYGIPRFRHAADLVLVVLAAVAVVEIAERMAARRGRTARPAEGV